MFLCLVPFPSSGRVRVHSAHPYLLGDGQMYGHHEVLHHEPVPFTVNVVADSFILLLPSEDLKEMLKLSSVLRDYALLDSRVRHHVDAHPESGSGVSRL
jgi:hypothetical protein